MSPFLAFLSTLVEILGFAAIVLAAWLVDHRLGIATGGAVLVVVGFALDRPARGVG